ncbi:hypothetical protein BDW60DRAFT_205063 [Aspergillus nidulans var. acristatus]
MFPSPTSSPSSLSSSPSSSPSLSPSPSPSDSDSDSEPYTLFFRQPTPESPEHTSAVFQIKDSSTINTFRSCQAIDLRIERHGDLTLSSSIHPPLHQFQLRPSLSFPSKAELGMNEIGNEIEFDLPERLDLNISDRGIVGRQVTVVARGGNGEVLRMGRGIVGFD